MKAIALFAIRLYQRYISPHKGFCCAYRVHTGYRSCSALGYRAIRLYGVLPGIAVLQKRFKRCTAAHQQHLALSHSGHQAINPLTLACSRLALTHNHHHRLRHSSQQGFCDVPCDCPSVDMSCDLPCDTPSGDSVHRFCNALDFGDCCDCGDWQRPRKNAEETPPPYIPPRRQGS